MHKLLYALLLMLLLTMTFCIISDNLYYVSKYKSCSTHNNIQCKDCIWCMYNISIHLNPSDTQSTLISIRDSFTSGWTSVRLSIQPYSSTQTSWSGSAEYNLADLSCAITNKQKLSNLSSSQSHCGGLMKKLIPLSWIYIQ